MRTPNPTLVVKPTLLTTYCHHILTSTSTPQLWSNTTVTITWSLQTDWPNSRFTPLGIHKPDLIIKLIMKLSDKNIANDPLIRVILNDTNVDTIAQNIINLITYHLEQNAPLRTLQTKKKNSQPISAGNQTVDNPERFSWEPIYCLQFSWRPQRTQTS